jgi:plasmid stabilization system protein ParE
MKNYKLGFKDQLKNDLVEIIAYYEKEKPFLGVEFEFAFNDLLDRLEDNPYAYQKALDQYRRGLTEKFPYAVWYQIFESIKEVEVASVVHQSRSIETIRKKLGLE